ncbi:Hypothetical predicted protein [Podarcis lilfordi]|uniref:Uncharacterized protein n=1 Tax=Podarcis lilfordi TaxID=74358 RepID=A0AA35LGL7_9SAUR|nr:Hypothetical predicted protein [Podarcis lilfordi]
MERENPFNAWLSWAEQYASKNAIQPFHVFRSFHLCLLFLSQCKLLYLHLSSSPKWYLLELDPELSAFPADLFQSSLNDQFAY